MAVRNGLKVVWRLLRNAEASVAAEAALVFPFFLLSLMGVLEITQFVHTKERVNRVVNQVAKVLAAPEGDGQINAVLGIAADMGGFNRPSIHLIMCRQDIGNGTAAFTYEASYRNKTGYCGYGTGSASKVVKAICPPPPSSENPGFSTSINVMASCNYNPQFDFLGIFGNSLQIAINSSMPMQGDPENANLP